MTNRITELDISTEPAFLPNECYQKPFFSFHKGDALNLIKHVENESVDCVLTDPPYLYLKGQKLERDFDENLFFTECKRILKKKWLCCNFWAWYFVLSLEYDIIRFRIFLQRRNNME